MLPLLRLLADDLTGALDSAATFGSLSAPLPVRWRPEDAGRTGDLAFDTGTREAPSPIAARIVRRVAGSFFREPCTLAFKKIDSLLRGSEADELDALLAVRPFRRCVVAPAFPAQRRATRGGRQGVVGLDGSFQPVATDLRARLEALGRPVHTGAEGKPLASGITIFDANTDRDLDAIVDRHEEDVLWVGSAGLASALARRWTSPAPANSFPALPGPLLGLFGTDHEVMLRQLDAVASHRLELTDAQHAPAVARHLAERGAVFVSAALPPALSRAEAAERIASMFGALALRLDAPGTLVAAGGETLRALCDALGARGLDVCGELLPGIAYSRMAGGRWNGTGTVSKSGAFGTPDFLEHLLSRVSAPPVGALQT